MPSNKVSVRVRLRVSRKPIVTTFVPITSKTKTRPRPVNAGVVGFFLVLILGIVASVVQLMGSSSANKSAGSVADSPTATMLKLTPPTATIIPTPTAPSGTYEFQLEYLNGSNHPKFTLRRIIILDNGDLRVEVEYYIWAVSAETDLECPPWDENRLYLQTTLGRVAPKETYCSLHPGEKRSLKLGARFLSYGVFPNSGYLSKPFTLYWYEGSHFDNISLRK